MRILNNLSSILFPKDQAFVADSPVVLQTLLRALFTLLYDLTVSGFETAEAKSITGYISALQTGSGGQLTVPSVEKEFGLRFSSSDSESTVRRVIITESVISCIELGPLEIREWALQLLPEVRSKLHIHANCLILLFAQYWPEPEPNVTFSSLLACTHWRKLKRFMGAALALLSEPSTDTARYAELVIALFRSRILPEISGLREEDAPSIRGKAVQLVLELLSIRDSLSRDYLLMHLENWYQADRLWKESIESSLQDLVSSLRILRHLSWTSLLVDF
jgi:hypothetical protein